MGQEIAIFRHTLQISDGIPTDSCKFLTEVIMGAQNVNYALKFYQKRGVLAPNCAFLDKNFMTRLFSDNFLTTQNFPTRTPRRKCT